MRSSVTSFMYLLIFVVCLGTYKVSSMEISSNREERLIFNIVKFQNGPCGTGSQVGTCYTTDECANRGGTSGSSCASGYGTCCTFTADCGGTVTENSTILMSSGDVTDCSYTICRCSNNICRIRLDFFSNVLEGPTQGNVEQTFGSCESDSFTITSSQGAPPTICGFNTGQHMIINADEGCHTALFQINEAVMATRMWNINVTQYACGDEFAGPPGCLQYFTSPTGTVKSFNYETMANSVHLANQDYSICFRREDGNCRICYAAVGDSEFGLSLSPGKTPLSDIDSNCMTDFLEIPSGTTNSVVTVGAALVNVNKFCGRFLNTARNKGAATICSFSVPFRIRLFTDGSEILGKVKTSLTNEASGVPAGTLGFQLGFKQFPCV